MAKKKNSFNSLPIPALLNKNIVGEIPQPYKREEVKQDLIPSDPKQADVLTKDITKEVLDKAFQKLETQSTNVGGFPATISHTLTFTLNNVKIINTLFYWELSSSTTVSATQFTFNVKVNGATIRTFQLYDANTLNITPSRRYLPFNLFADDLFVGSEIKIEISGTGITGASPGDITTSFIVEGYQF